MKELIFLIIIGITTGILSGFFGLGGGIFIIPLLTIFMGFDQKMAQGTTLLMMIPPLGVFAAYEYYKEGNVNIKAALIIGILFMLGSWIGSKIVKNVDSLIIKKIFGGILFFLSLKMLFK